MTLVSTTPVSGLGDQAEFVVVRASLSELQKVDILYVLYGKLYGKALFLCVNFFTVGNAPDATQQRYLTQCAQYVMAGL